jgi:hypothetical protein
MPAVEELVAANADTVVLFAGDGTINAAACKYDKWHGKALILPGGTMNMLARQLHGEAEPHDIVHKAHEAPLVRTMPFVESGPAPGAVRGDRRPGGDLGERARGGAVSTDRRFVRAVRVAWARTWSRGVTLSTGPAGAATTRPC